MSVLKAREFCNSRKNEVSEEKGFSLGVFSLGEQRKGHKY